MCTAPILSDPIRCARSYTNDGPKAAQLASALPLMQLGAYALKRQEKAFAALLKVVKEVFCKQARAQQSSHSNAFTHVTVILSIM